MFSREFQRILLFGALGLALFTIWQSWVEFEQQYNSTAQNNQTNTATQHDAPGDSSAVSANTTSSDGDVPAAPISPTAAPSSTVPSSEEDTIRNARLLNITTDLIRAQIDPHGGDLVRVELLRHPVSVDQPDQPFVLLNRDHSGLFVAQNGLIGNDAGRKYPDHKVVYSVSTSDYDLGEREQMEVMLNWRAPDGVRYQKVFRFRRDTYRIEVDFRVDNQSTTPWNGFVYGQLKRTPSEPVGTLGLFGVGGLPSYDGAAVYTSEEKYEKIDYDDMRESPLNLTTDAGWVAMLQRYFVAVWLPTNSSTYQFFSGVSQNDNDPQYRIGYKSTQSVGVASGATGVLPTVLFVGPKEQNRLEQQQAKGLLLTVDYGFLTPIADPLFWLLDAIHGVVNNWGWAIILLTLLVKLVFYPLSAASYKSMAKMRKLQPRLKTLKERYGEDKQKFQQEMMKLYKTEKINPAGGCLPMLVQIPVFIALYWTLLESVELRQAEFMFWIKDLSIPDPYFVLPLVMGASMLVQFMLNPAPVDPMQKRLMMAMPIVFTIFFLWFPAGLVLYWVVNNLLSIAQQYHVTRKYAAL